uniref:Uncharacterized protein n=1 Tax=Rhizophora mucronata TaxID=61149 RepID=A0A2P2IQY3_RHIMU
MTEDVTWNSNTPLKSKRAASP